MITNAIPPITTIPPIIIPTIGILSRLSNNDSNIPPSSISSTSKSKELDVSIGISTSSGTLCVAKFSNPSVAKSNPHSKISLTNSSF